MVTKILFTLAVVGVVIWLIRFRQRPGPVAPSHRSSGGARPVRGIALAVLAVMVVSGLAVAYLRWNDAHQVVRVTVIDSGTGRVSRYAVYRDRLKERSFETVDGRQVRLAVTERMEVTAAPGGSPTWSSALPTGWRSRSVTARSNGPPTICSKTPTRESAPISISS